MSKIITVANQKGGVGKTTTVINLSTALAAIDKKVLVIDFDPQANSTTGLGINKNSVRLSSYSMLLGERPQDCIVSTNIENIDLVSSSQDLAAAEVELCNIEEGHTLLKRQIQKIANRYDFIFIDCPPALGMLTINSMSASNSVIIPVQCEFFALDGLVMFTKTFERIKNTHNPDLQIEGILLTMYDKRYKLTAQVESNVREYFQDKVYQTVIPRSVRIAEAPSHGKPILIYDLNSAGAKSYLNLAKELIKRNNILF